MTAAKILVTGGSGFIGAALVKALVHSGATVRVLDDNSRGSTRRLKAVANDIEFIAGDIRDADAVAAAAQGMDELHHLAFVNGTEFFYSQPELVLDVGVRGMVNVIDACRKQKVGTLILASSSEVYQTPPTVPTAEDAPLVVPDVLNPRFSYGAGKLISEVMAINFGRKYFERVLIFRPHNVYGPDMGWEHVVPQFALRLHALGNSQPSGRLRFEIQGSGAETRSFCFVDDLVAGVMVMRDKGEHLGIYHIGTAEEVTIAELARRIAHLARREIELVPGKLQAGGTMRRCPDISKLAQLGYKPRVPLNEGLKPTLDWYWSNAQLAPEALTLKDTMQLGPSKVARAAGSGASVPVECCQVCGSTQLDDVLSLGYMPPVNQMVPIGQVPRQQPWFPTNLLHCRDCDLVQLGLAVDPVIIFPPEYPYTSGTTKLLRDNFADLHRESAAMLGLGEKDLVVDIGSNDGTLLSNFQNGGHRVLGIEPTDVGDIANGKGIPTLKRYFGVEVAREVKREHGPASVVTAANCFAHIEDVHAIVDGIVEMLAPNGVFISESHYLIGLLDTLQYDTIYHEHLRYYSVTSLKHLLEMHDLEVFHARPIPSHGGSIRVYAARRGAHTVQDSVRHMLAAEPRGKAMTARLASFKRDVLLSKLRLLSMLRDLKEKGARIVGISAPSRASTLFNYVGLDDGIIDYVCEIPGSLKIGKCMPGTTIPVVDEARLFSDQPDCAIIFSWHIADELAPKLKAKGFRGKLITPLPVPRFL